jgi:hypothetical protein
MDDPKGLASGKCNYIALETFAEGWISKIYSFKFVDLEKPTLSFVTSGLDTF